MKGKLFLKLFFTISLILIITVATTLFALRPILDFEDLWRIRNFNVPFLLFMGSIILFFSLVFGWVIQYSLFKTEKGISEKLHWLNLGNYNKSDVDSNRGVESSVIEEEIESLRIKLIQLSREVQELSSIPRMIGTETKEQILEQERHRVARELHDSVSQQLFAAMMMLSAINEQKDQIPEKLQKSLQMVDDIVNESQSEMRALLLHLRPVKLEGKTLKKGIEQLLNELSSKIHIKLKWEIMPVDTTPGIEDHLFRIVQEIFSNTLRHAKASTLEVYLNQNDQEINLRIFDDGVGFDTSVNKSGSYGLTNIKERVSGLGGTCKIISFPKQGTIVDIRIPNTMQE